MLKFYLTIVILFNVLCMNGQQMIGVTPYLGSDSGAPKGTEKTLEHKLTQLVTQSGFGSVSGEFFLTCNVLVVNKEAVPTIPVQYSVELEVSFYLVNALEQVIIGEYPVTVKGLESNETKAYIQALNLVNPRNPKLRKFMTDCRDKIVAYYAARTPVLIAKAQSLADRQQYNAAMAVLGTIPECVEEYPAVAELSTKVYVKMLDRDATAAINRAKSALAEKKYGEALGFINSVNPASTYANRAYAMIDDVKSGIEGAERAKEAKEAAQQEKQAKDEQAYRELLAVAMTQKEEASKVTTNPQAFEDMKVKAAMKIAMAEAQSQIEEESPRILDSLNSWLFNKLRN